MAEDIKEDQLKADQPGAGKKETTESTPVEPETPATEAVEETKEEAPTKEKAEEPKVEEPKAEAPVEKPEPSGKFKDLIKEIEELSVADLADLVKALEERFGVSAAMPLAAAAGAANASGGEVAEEKTHFTVFLSAAGEQKINVIKAVREIRSDLGLKEAKDLVDGAPKEVAKDLPKEEAETAKGKLEAAGATVELK